MSYLYTHAHRRLPPSDVKNMCWEPLLKVSRVFAQTLALCPLWLLAFELELLAFGLLLAVGRTAPFSSLL